ncbi:MAG: hypothetical protein IJW55_06905 [Clostridia bacterium]|nr:hypothetical protein [Clostridia bacterium]
MNHTAQSNEELIQQIRAYLKDEMLHQILEDESQGEFKLLAVLTKRFDLEKTLVVATNQEDVVFMFYPFSSEEKFSEPWFFNPNELFFEPLANGYEILLLTIDTHIDIWDYVDTMGKDHVEYEQGLQRYLDYCQKNGITKDVLKRKGAYDGINLMEYYIPRNRNMER